MTHAGGLGPGRGPGGASARSPGLSAGHSCLGLVRAGNPAAVGRVAAGWGDTGRRPLPTSPPQTSGADSYVQVVLPLEGLAADFADVLALLAVRQVVLAERAGAAEHLPAEAAVQERVLRRGVLPLPLPRAPRGGPASVVSLFGHLKRAQPQV